MEQRRGALFFIFLQKERKRPKTRPNDQKSGLTHDLMISFFILTSHTHPKHKAEEEDKEEEEEEDEERETTALFIRHYRFVSSS
jgi:hypothetical protein